MSNGTYFKPRARLILQLGDQLIKNESIALLELVKNSYDAGASEAVIRMESLDNPSQGFITVKDNGCGMNAELIKNVWLEMGSDYKEKLLKKMQGKGKKYRRPLGEKGIGRFSAHKLGKTCEVITRMKDEQEVYVKINWTDFEKVTYINQVPIKILERKPEIFTGIKTGTLIRIIELRPNQWSKQSLREVFRSVNAFSSPFETSDSFSVSFSTDNPTDFADIPTIKDIRKLALYRFNCEIEGNEITTFSYRFEPFVSMDKLKKRKLVYNIEGLEDNFDGFEKMKAMVGRPVRNPKTNAKESPPIDLSANGLKIGKVRFEGLIFDRQSKVLKYAQTDTKTLKEYLDRNGGVRIYRDGIRIYDYGELENDWLGLEKKRMYDPGVRINKGLILAAVHLDREDSTDLIEKTNREGFIDNEAYKTLRDAISYAIKIIESCRNEDKDNIRTYYGLSPKSEPVLANIDELRDVIESRIKDDKLQKECLFFINQIEKEYREINEILLTSAEAGLNLSVAIHEIGKIASELGEVVRKEQSSERIIKLVRHLAELIDMYGVLIRKGKNKKENLVALIDDALFNVQYRLKAHRVEVIREYRNFKGDSDITCSSRLIIGSILNLIDNSIYWLERADTKSKKIFISLKRKSTKHLRLLVADNGQGFALPPDQLTKPFVSLKPGGIGLGLHIASEAIAAQGGMIDFPEYSKKELPLDFRNGAMVSLIFKGED